MNKYLLSLASAALLLGCTPPPAQDEAELTSPPPVWTDLSKLEKPSPITDKPWKQLVIGVPSFDDVPKLFTDIGGFETRSRDENSWTISAPNTDGGYIRFELTAPDAVSTRPFGSQSWDTGCYFSVMMRAKNLPSIILDAQKLGWAPLTEMAYLEFGPSKLNIVVLGHKTTGIQVQLYERLTTPIPEGFPEFERLSRPFNVMQMVKDRNAAYTFYRQGLGFENFYFGKPSLSEKLEIMPLGIPKSLTMTVPYHTGIVTPKVGLEWGRMEMIQVDMPDGKNLTEACQAGNIGIHTVGFEIPDLREAEDALRARGVAIRKNSTAGSFQIKSPDGANIEFVQK